MRKLLAVLAFAVMAAGTGAAVSMPAHAAPRAQLRPVSEHLSMLVSSDPTGVCSGGECWRDTGPVDNWPRDISGDPHQQFDVSYWGQAPGAAGGECSMYSGIGVYSFISPADGYKFVSAGYFSQDLYYVGDQVNDNQYSFWVWESNGVLANCGDAAATGHSYLLEAGTVYGQLFTEYAVTGNEWEQVHV